MTISNTVENPIIASPFEEPTRHYKFGSSATTLRESRTQECSVVEQEHILLDLVNAKRKKS